MEESENTPFNLPSDYPIKYTKCSFFFIQLTSTCPSSAQRKKKAFRDKITISSYFSMF